MIPDVQSFSDRRRHSWRFRVAVALWSVVTALYCFGELLGDINPFFFIFALLWLAVPWVGLPVWAVAVAAEQLGHGAYKSAGLTALVPVLAIGTLAYGRYIGDAIRFERERPAYAARIDAARKGVVDNDIEVDQGPLMVAFFPWGGFLTTSYGAIFDETDQAAKPLAERLKYWHGRNVPAELKCPGDVLSLGGYFYVGHFTC